MGMGPHTIGPYIIAAQLYNLHRIPSEGGGACTLIRTDKQTDVQCIANKIEHIYENQVGNRISRFLQVQEANEMQSKTSWN